MSNVHSTEYNFRPKDALLGAQMLFVAFGALVLVPLLTGLDANVALFTAGAGTLVFQVITKGKVPVFLASSFAFIAPIIYGVQTWGIPATMCGLLGAGLLYVIFSFLIRIFGVGVLRRVLPPVVTGPVIMVIGLYLAPVAVHMAMGRTGDGGAWLVPNSTAMIIAGVALITTIFASLLGKGWIKLIPILMGIIAGYVASLILDATGFTAATQAAFDPGKLQNFTAPALISFGKIAEAPVLAMPNFVFPTWNLEAILFIVPVAIAPAIEHFGDILAIGGISGKDYVKDPGIQNTMLGDGIATSLAAALGGPPEHHLLRGLRRRGPDPRLQPGHHDLGGHHRHRARLRGQARGRAEHHPGPGHGRHHDPALRRDHGHRHQHPGPRGQRPHAPPQHGHRGHHPGLRHRRHVL